MTWKPATLEVPFDNRYEIRKETHPSAVNEHGLHVLRITGSWQIANPDGFKIATFTTRREARRVADEIGAKAPYGWSREGLRRWVQESPDGLESILKRGRR